MTAKKFIIMLLIVGLAGAGGWAFFRSDRYQSWLAEQEKNSLPVPEQLAESIAAPAINAVVNRYGAAAVPLPSEKNLAIPFTSQAPHANWDQDHEEFCEEAAVLMAARFLQHRTIANPDDAEQALQQIKTWELDNLGFFYDTTAAETARILTDFYELKVELKVDPTIDDIKRAVVNGHPVLVPTAGRELGNPNFTAPGPIYHFLVIRGYTDDGKFITNDPGTRKGEEYVYDQDVIMAAMHDWVPNGERTAPRNGDVANGRKVVLIVSGS